MILPAFSQAEDQWELLEKQDKLELYTSKKSINGIFPYKARLWIPYTIPEILAVFLDNEKKTQWVPRLRKSWAEDDQNSLGHRVEYGEILIPWPFSNRDILVKIETQVIGSINNVRLYAYSVQNDRVISRSNVRAIVHPSDLRMTYDPKTKETLLETVSFTDPGGYIPKWLVNLFQKGEAINLTLNLVKQLEKNIYPKNHLSFINTGLKKMLRNSKNK